MDITFLGHPLLDMIVADAPEILDEFKLPVNGAVHAGQDRIRIYDTLQHKYEVTFVAGGTEQNAARAAKCALPRCGVAFVGCIGDDSRGNILREANERAGVVSHFQIANDTTGSCAVIVTDVNRSLCTNLAAAEKLDKEFLLRPDVQNTIKSSKFVYGSAFWLINGYGTISQLASLAAQYGNRLVFGLAAPFVIENFTSQVDDIISRSAIVIGNDSEFESYAATHGLPDKEAALLHVARLGSPPSSRYVLMTQGDKPTLLSTGEDISRYPVDPVRPDEIADTNGAGDAFAGGFLAIFSTGASVHDSIEAGHRLAQRCIRRIGAQF